MSKRWTIIVATTLTIEACLLYFFCVWGSEDSTAEARRLALKIALVTPLFFAVVFLFRDGLRIRLSSLAAVSYTHLRAHETLRYLVCRLLLEKKK